MGLEVAARRRYASASRYLQQTAVSSSASRLQAIRRASAASVRADLEAHSLPGLKAKLRLVPVATEHEVADIARRLNAGVAFLFPEGRGQSTFFKLFRHMDSDDSGLVAYFKLLKLVRTYLRIDARQISDREMQGLWRALDPAETGSIGAGAFIKMMRKGWKSMHASSSREEPRPQWSPITMVRVRDYGSPALERTLAMEEVRKSVLGNARELEAKALAFEEQARLAERLAISTTR